MDPRTETEPPKTAPATETWPRCRLEEVASLVDGTLLGTGGFEVAGIAYDSREVSARELFVALPGQRVDGHDFVEEAWRRGAAVLVHRKPPRLEGPAVLVEDTLAALQRWAARRLEHSGVRVVGITGSVGKTSVKEMTAPVLATRYRVHRTFRNRNGQLGVPLTLLGMPPETEVLVLEMGVSHPGEMDRLLAMAAPEVAVLTGLSQVHCENFPGYVELVAEKRRLLLGGTVSPPRCNVVQARLTAVVSPLPGQMLTYGFEEEAAVRGTDVELLSSTASGPPRSRCVVHGLGEPLELELPFWGRAMAENALGSLAVGYAMGCDPPAMAETLRQLRLDAPMRQEWHSAGGVTWINDAYNASPASTRAALELLGSHPGAERRIAVLGDMLELGPESVALHRQLARLLVGKVDHLLTFGPLARETADSAHVPAEAFGEMAALVERLLELVRPGDLVLFKASRGLRLERAAEALERHLASSQ